MILVIGIEDTSLAMESSAASSKFAVPSSRTSTLGGVDKVPDPQAD